MLQQRLRTGRQDIVIPAGRVAWVKCQLHRNLLLLVNDLPVEVTPSDTRPIPEKKTHNRQNQDRMTDTQRQADTSEDSENDSDADSGSGYWLRRPIVRTEERPVIYQEQRTRHPEIRGSGPNLALCKEGDSGTSVLSRRF